MNNKNTKNNILYKIMVLLVVFSLTVIDTVPLWVNTRALTKEEVPTEGLQEGTKEEGLLEEELEDGVEEELTDTDEDFKYVPYIEDLVEKEETIEVTYIDGETIEVQDSDDYRRARVVFKDSSEDGIEEETEKLADYLLSLSTETVENEDYEFDEKEGLTETLIQQWEEVLELDKNGVEKDNLEKLEGLMDTVHEFTLYGKEDEVKEDEVKEDEIKEDEVKEDEVKEDEVKEDEVKEDEVKEDEMLTKAVKETNIGKGLLMPTYGTKVKSILSNTNEAMVARTNTSTPNYVMSTYGTKVKSNLMSTNATMVATTSTTTPNYVLAKDSDFSGYSNGDFRYIGRDEYVVIPHVIKGVNVTSYYHMFDGTSVKGVASTNKNVTNMSYMFRDSQATSLDLSSFNTSRVTSMHMMFYNSQATSIDLSNFDTSRVTGMNYMFAYSQATSLDLSNFDTSSVTDMYYMFYNSQATIGYARTQAEANRLNSISDNPYRLTFKVMTQELRDFNEWVKTLPSHYKVATDSDFSGYSNGDLRYIGRDEYVVIPHVIKGVNVTRYYEMFRDTSVKGVASTNKNVTNMSYMFRDSQATSLDLSNFDTSSVTDMYYMFWGSQATSLDLSSFDTSSVTYMGYMFVGSQATSLDLSSFDTSRVRDMYAMFFRSQATSLDLSSFDTSSVTDMSYIFQSSPATIGYARTQADADRFNRSSLKPSGLTFIVMTQELREELREFNEWVKTLPSHYKVATDADFSGTSNGNFKYIGTDEYVVIPHVIKGVNVTSYSYMFNGTSVKGVASTNKNVTDMRGMFAYSNATIIDLSNFDTSKVTDMYQMFYESQATSLDLSSFNTSRVTSMHMMFYNSQATSIDLSNFDTSSVTDMSYMFYNTQATSLDLSSFDTSSVTKMNHMFYLSRATSLDLSSFDTSNVTSMWSMFNRSQATSLDLSSFDTSKVTEMSHMFYLSRATSLDLSSFDTSNVTDDMRLMFYASPATIGYARTQADADRFNGSFYKPSTLTFIVKEVEPPTGTITGNPTSWTNQNVTLTFNATDESGVKRVQRPDGTWVNGSSTTHTVTSNGAYTFKAEDNLGNTGTYSVTVNRIDKTLPTVTFGTNGNGTARQSHSTTVNVEDTGSGVSTRQYQWTTSTATPTSGTWTSFTNGTTLTRSTGTGNIYLHIRATDNAGNVQISRSNAFNMDNTEPTTPTLTANTTAWTNGNVTVTGTYSTDSTVKQYRIGSGSWTNYTAPFTVSANETIEARAQDSAGNWSTTRSLNVTNIDKTAPNGTITGNTTSWVNKDITLTFNATDSGGSGVRRVRIKGGTWVNGATTTLAVSSNGTYTFEVEDNAGNTRDVSIVVDKIDKSLPTGTISGNPTSWTNSNQTITFTATDTGGSGVKRVRVKDGSWVTGSTTTLVVSSNGTYVFTVEDNADNTRDVSVVVNRIDKSLPTVSYGTNGNSTPRKSQSTTVNVTDTGSGVSTRQYQWTTSSTFPTSGTWTNFTNGETITRNSGTGNYYLHIRATDVAGNVRQVTSSVFNVDNTAPIAPTYTPSTTGWTNGNVTVTINYPTDANIKEYVEGKGERESLRNT